MTMLSRYKRQHVSFWPSVRCLSPLIHSSLRDVAWNGMSVARIEGMWAFIIVKAVGSRLVAFPVDVIPLVICRDCWHPTVRMIKSRCRGMNSFWLRATTSFRVQLAELNGFLKREEKFEEFLWGCGKDQLTRLDCPSRGRGPIRLWIYTGHNSDHLMNSSRCHKKICKYNWEASRVSQCWHILS
jgi:hypothetical protein